MPGRRSAYDKSAIRRSIEYPVTGVSVALAGRERGVRVADLPAVAFSAPPRHTIRRRVAGSRVPCP